METVDVAELQKKTGKSFKDVGELEDYLNKSPGIDISDMNMLGNYENSGTEIPAITSAIFPLLEIAESPFVGCGGEDAEVTRMHYTQALYIIFHGRDAVRPLFALAKRAAALEELHEECVGNNEKYKMYMDKKDEIAHGWAIFEEAAIEFEESLKIEDYAQLQSDMGAMFNNIYKAVGDAAIKAEGQKKKDLTEQHG